MPTFISNEMHKVAIEKPHISCFSCLCCMNSYRFVSSLVIKLVIKFAFLTETEHRHNFNFTLHILFLCCIFFLFYADLIRNLSPFLGWIYDRTKDYTLPFILAGIPPFVGAAMMTKIHFMKSSEDEIECVESKESSEKKQLTHDANSSKVNSYNSI